MNFKLSFNDQPNIASFTTLIERNFHFLSFIYQKISKKSDYDKPNTVQTLRFPLKIEKLICLKLEIKNLFFAETPQTHSVSKLERYFSFTEKYQKPTKIRAQY